MKQYGCDPNSYKPKDLFALLYEFAKDFSESYKRMQQKIKTEQDKLKRMAAKKQSSG